MSKSKQDTKKQDESVFSSNSLFIIGTLIRIGLVLYSEIQDYYTNIKFTDLDYSVYTNGAYEVLNGGTPYDSHTYRYTPLLAYMLTPNVFLWNSFGKFFFTVSDILCSVMLRKILFLTTNLSTKAVDSATAIWVLNPMIFIVSTRGNADTLISLMVLIALYYLAKGNILAAALMYGTACHFKIFPLVYSLPIYFSIDADQQKFSLFTRKRLTFALVSAAVFIGLFLVFYAIYGWQFAFEGYFYHLIRKDNRHNFSVYFYYIYLNFMDVNPTQAVVVFLPQVILLVATGVKYYRDIPFCCFVQTFIFVMFNKVMTAQYFVWFITYMPLFLYKNSLYLNHKWKLYGMFVAWLAVEVSWNYGAHQVEAQGVNEFKQIWIMCLAFFFANLVVICSIIKTQQPVIFSSNEYKGYKAVANAKKDKNSD